MIDFFIRGIFLIYIIYAGIVDFKKKQVNLLVLGGVFVVEMVLIIMMGPGFLGIVRLLGIFIGFFFIMLSKISRGAVGSGDGIVIGAAGYVFGVFSLIEILFLSWAINLPFAIFYILKGNRKKKLPFLPFMAIGYILFLIFGIK